MVQAVKKKPFVNLTVVEAEHLDGDAVRLAEASAKNFAVVVSDGNRVASLQIFRGLVNGS